MSIRTALANRLRRATLRVAAHVALLRGSWSSWSPPCSSPPPSCSRDSPPHAGPGVETQPGRHRHFEIGAGDRRSCSPCWSGSWFAWQLAGGCPAPASHAERNRPGDLRHEPASPSRARGSRRRAHPARKTLDDLFGRLEASFESQRHFVANASHELRTPLAGQRTLLQVALADPDATAESLRAACEEALAARRATRAARRRAPHPGEQRARDRTPGALRPRRDRANACSSPANKRRRGAASRYEHRSTPRPPPAIPSSIESMIANLLDNAIQHNIPDGSVELTTSRLRRSVPAVSAQHGTHRSHGRSRATLSALPAAGARPNPVWRRPRARPGHRPRHRQSPPRHDHRTPPLGWRARHRGQLPLATRLDHGPVMTQHMAAAERRVPPSDGKMPCVVGSREQECPATSESGVETSPPREVPAGPGARSPVHFHRSAYGRRPPQLG